MKVFIFDHDKCNGCRNCQLACKDEHCGNEWPPYAKPQPETGQFWLKVNEKVRGQVPKVRASYTVRMCQHCEDASCMTACPEAVWRRDDGLVIIDPAAVHDKGKLLESCPFGAIYWNDDLNIAQKCTGCAHLLDAGWSVPRCVDVCPHGALRFGEESEFSAETSAGEELIAQAGNRPRVHYLNLPKRFASGIVVDTEADEVVIGATVTLTRADSDAVVQTVTDDFGDFWFHQIDATHYELHVVCDGYLEKTLGFDTADADRNVGVIELSRKP
jgi:Fe-S-cluster-containing dehydrogenase component